jgi:phosphatidylglycerol:prolipoprotein diacylglycerol transferase
MLAYPAIDPIAFYLGPWPVRWYGLTYVAAFFTFWWLCRRRAREPWRQWQVKEVDDLLFYSALGVILGGRIGYIVFYDLIDALRHPWTVIRVWEGGMSFHGGLLGVLLAMLLFARSSGRTFFQVTDFIAPMVPPGLGFGRIGNFINSELWGKPTDVPWGMLVPGAGDIARHPSQLYQALLEGLGLFLLLWLFSKRPRPSMAVSGLFLLGYGVARFVVEFVRLPDEHLGYLAFEWLTMGQVLSAPMILCGIALIWWAYRSPAKNSAARLSNAAARHAGAESHPVRKGRRR